MTVARRRRRGRLAASLVAAIAFYAAPAAPQPAADWPASAVGRVLIDEAGPCSGVLIEAARVLTVGHCVADRATWQPLPARRLTFVLDGTSHAVAKVRLPASSPFDGSGTIRDLRHDWAVLALERASAIRPVAYGGPAAARLAYILEEPLAKIGWTPLPGGLAMRRRDEACTVRRLDPDGTLLVYGCAGGPGSGRSGSALLLQSAEGWRVAAVQSAVGDPGGVPVGIAVAPAPGILMELR